VVEIEDRKASCDHALRVASKIGGFAATETNAPAEPPSLGSYGVPRRGGYRPFTVATALCRRAD